MMKNMKKAAALGMAAVIAASAFSACGSNDNGNKDSKDKGSKAASDAGGTLQVNIWDNNQLDGLQKIADEWTKESGVKVNIMLWNGTATGHC